MRHDGKGAAGAAPLFYHATTAGWRRRYLSAQTGPWRPREAEGTVMKTVFITG